jgi:hypothetical protein
VSRFLNLILNGEYGMSLKAGKSVLILSFQTVVNICSIFVVENIEKDLILDADFITQVLLYRENN